MEYTAKVKITLRQGSHGNYDATLTAFKNGEEHGWITRYFSNGQEAMHYLFQFCHSRPEGEVVIVFVPYVVNYEGVTDRAELEAETNAST